MADIIDEANDLAQARIEDQIARNQAAIRDMPQGEPGDCRVCGDHMPRLVDRTCAPCRDELN